MIWHLFQTSHQEKQKKLPPPPPKKQKTSWWFGPIWKILVKLGHFANFRDEKQIYLKPPPRKTTPTPTFSPGQVKAWYKTSRFFASSPQTQHWQRVVGAARQNLWRLPPWSQQGVPDRERNFGKTSSKEVNGQRWDSWEFCWGEVWNKICLGRKTCALRERERQREIILRYKKMEVVVEGIE